MEAARTMLYARALPLSWVEAVHHTINLLKITLSKGGSITPFDAFHGFKPDLQNLLIFCSVPSESKLKIGR
jgi:hypothetical protein